MLTKLELDLEDYVEEQSSSNQALADDLEEKIELKYGHTISFQLYDMNECSLTTDGFMKPKIHAQQIGYTNQDKALFMIYPSFNTSNLDKLQNLSKMSKKDKKSFEKRVLDDYKQNIDSFEKMKGTPVLFDQSLQLLNINTNKFLSCNYQEAEEEKQNFKLELMDFSSKNTLFKIIPSFIHQDKKDGVVFSNDIVMIVSAEKYLGRDPYVQCNVQKYKEQMLAQKVTNQNPFKQSGYQRSPSIKKQQKVEKYNEIFDLIGSNTQPNMRPEKPNKGLFQQYDTTTTEFELRQVMSNAGQEELEPQRPQLTNLNTTQNMKVNQKQAEKKEDKREELNQSSEVKSGYLDTNIRVHEQVRPSQVHKFKKDVN